MSEPGTNGQVVDGGPSSKPLLWGLLALGVVVFGTCVLFNATQVIHWDGSKDVGVQFIVVEGEAGVPVPGAKVAVYDEESRL
jgi:hypothetical protein